jgi:hypothetical protein
VTTVRFRARRELRRNPVVKARIGVGASATVAGMGWVARTHWDRAAGWSVLLFGLYAIAAVVFLVALQASVDPNADPAPSVISELVKTSQAALLTITATTLGLLSAFGQGKLPLVTKLAGAALVAAVLVQFVVNASGARTHGLGRAAWRMGVWGDNLAEHLFSFGLIALAVSLFDRSPS